MKFLAISHFSPSGNISTPDKQLDGIADVTTDGGMHVLWCIARKVQ